MGVQPPVGIGRTLTLARQRSLRASGGPLSSFTASGRSAIAQLRMVARTGHQHLRSSTTRDEGTRALEHDATDELLSVRCGREDYPPLRGVRRQLSVRYRWHGRTTRL